jgi:MFS transporter, OFA family, oxalate/formate antiporter
MADRGRLGSVRARRHAVATAARALAHPRWFYGWTIVGIALVAQFVTAGAQTYASGVFLKPMTQDLGWSRESFSAVQTVSTVVMGSIGLVIGGLVDRRGPRPLMLVGGIIAGSALIATSRVETLWQFYLLRGVAQTLGNALLGNLVVNVTVAKWFVVRRGMAIALASIGISLGGVLMAPLVALVIDAGGWRQAWVFLGLLTWVLVLPSAWLIRRQPEDLGLVPDGLTTAQAERAAARRHGASAAAEVQWTRREAVRTTTIWLVILAYGIANIGLGAMLLHMVPFLTDHDVRTGQAALLFSVQSWAALLSKPLWGVLMDRYHARYLSAVGFLIQAAAIGGLLAVAPLHRTDLLVAVLLGYGFGIGGTVPLQETVWASYFGRTHLGSIRAVAVPFSILFGAGGPLLAGFLYDRSGSYRSAFGLFAICSVLGSVLVLLARPPRLPTARDPAHPTRAPAGPARGA